MHITIVKAKPIKNLKAKEFKAQRSELLSTCQYSNNFENSEKTWTEKKKDWYNQN